MIPAAVGGAALGLVWWISGREPRAHPPIRRILRGAPLAPRHPDAITVVCYNLLADGLARDGAAYAYADPLHLSWEFRWFALQGELAAFGADILCVQELDVDRWTEINTYMANLGYKGVLQSKKGNKENKGNNVLNAIFYRSSRFRLAWEDHRSRAIILALSWTNAEGVGQAVYVINVHLEGHPEKSTERVNQLYNSLRRMKDRQGDDAPQADIIVCGDFNCRRSGAPWELMYRGRLYGGHTEPHRPDVEVVEKTVAHPYAFKDVYMAAKSIPAFTTRAPRRRSEVDYLWCSRHMGVEAVMHPANPRDILTIDRTLLPNNRHPSDHLPLGAVLLPTRVKLNGVLANEEQLENQLEEQLENQLEE